jgi:hypothetical protein
MKSVPKTVGSFEAVSFPELGVKQVIAKIDTGAYSGALHATNIREITTDEGKQGLEFYPLGKGQLKTVTTRYSSKQVKSSNGQPEVRFVVRTKVIVKDQAYPISISLSDRTAMMKSVLLGRRFLRRHGFIVDVRRGTKHRYVVKDRKAR